MTTINHSRIIQQPAIVKITLGTGRQVLHSGIWMSRMAEAVQDESDISDHSEQFVIDQACIAAFEELEPDFDSRPVEVAYSAKFETEEAAAAFVDCTDRFYEDDVWCERHGSEVLMGFDNPLNTEMLLKASALVQNYVRGFGGVFAGWGMKEEGRSWMTVARAELEASITLH